MMKRYAPLVSFLLISLVQAGFAKGHSLAMWSIRSGDGSWKFVLVRDREVPPYWTEKEIMDAPSLNGIDPLKDYLKTLPPDTSIMWRDLPETKDIVFPSRSVISDITEYGKQHGLHLEVWPTVVD